MKNAYFFFNFLSKKKLLKDKASFFKAKLKCLKNNLQNLILFCFCISMIVKLCKNFLEFYELNQQSNFNLVNRFIEKQITCIFILRLVRFFVHFKKISFEVKMKISIRFRNDIKKQKRVYYLK